MTDAALALAQELARLEENAGEAARFLRAMSCERRLLTLCRLMVQGPADAVTLATDLRLAPEALMPDLAILQAEGIIGLQPDAGGAPAYRIEDGRALQLLSSLKDIFCPPGC